MSRLARSGRLGVLVAGVALVVVVALVTSDWLGKERSFAAAIPQPSPLLSTPVIAVRGGERICIIRFTLTPGSEIGSFRVGTRKKRSVPLRWAVRGSGGYVQRGRIAATWKDNDLLTFRIRPPREPIRARVCIVNAGRRVMDFYASEDQSRTSAETLVEGDRVGPNVQLRFDEETAATIGDRLGEIAEEMTVFRAFFVGRPLVWVLGLLVLAGVPVLVLVAMWRAAGDEPAPD